MQKMLCRSAMHVVRRRVDEPFVTKGTVRRTVRRPTNVVSGAKATLHGVPSPSVTHPEELRFRRLPFACFSLARTPRRKSPWGQRKAGAAPHRDNTNKP